MAKTKDQVLELERIRGSMWVERCLEVGARIEGLSEQSTRKYKVADLARFLVKEEPNPNLWSKYKLGHAQPDQSKVLAIEKKLPGTSEIWLSGPQGLPVWKVLAANSDEFRGWMVQELDRVLINTLRPPVWTSMARKRLADMDLLDKVQALLELSIPQSFFTKAWWRLPDEQRRSAHWPASDFSEEAEQAQLRRVLTMRFGKFQNEYVTLEDLAAGRPNVLTLAYHEGLERGSVAEADAGENNFNLLLPQRLLLLMGVVALLSPTKGELTSAVPLPAAPNSRLAIRSFLIEGLKDAVKDMFGQVIAGYFSAKQNCFDGQLLTVNMAGSKTDTVEV